MKKLFGLGLALTLILVGCSSSQTSDLTGKIQIDGSSTVAPITQAAMEEFAAENPGVDITMGISGTGGGFKKFVTGETQISNASRPIKKEEADLAKTGNVEFIELEVAKDALTVVVNSKNDWAKELTVEQLQKIFSKGNEKIKWSDLDPTWPAQEIKLYTPGTDSGTYDYFNEVVIGKGKEHRTDGTMAEDDNVLVTGVQGDQYSIAYFGFVYYQENSSKLKAVHVNGVEPTVDTVMDGTYTPLSRPLFIYVNKKAYAENDAVKAFVDFYLKNAEELVTSVGYIPLEASEYKTQMDLLK